MRRLLAGLATALALAGPAAAHRGHEALSVVEIDAATGAVTVTHKAAAHDVEPALSVIAPDAQQSLDDPAAVKALEAYGAKAFRLWDAEGRAVTLTHRQTVLEGDNVTLVYDAQLARPAASVSVDSNLFEDAHADQENQVNVRRARVTKSARFFLGADPETIAFE